MKLPNTRLASNKIYFIATLLVALAALLLTNCAPRSPGAITSPIVGPLWKWRTSQFNNGVTQTVNDPSRYSVEFGRDGIAQINADCNVGSAEYTLNGSLLHIEPIRMTRVACPEDSLDTAFVAELQSASSYLQSGSDMVLNVVDNTGRMIFTSERRVPTETATATVEAGTPVQQTATPIRLTATPGAGTPIPQTATPAVTAVPPTPTAIPPTATITPTPPPGCAGAPQISFFRIEPATIQRGQNAVLSWGKVLGATAVAIDNGIGGVATPGSIIVTPSTSTNYVMTATGCGGTVQAITHIVVAEPTSVPPTVAPTYTPTNVPTNVPPPTEAPTNTPQPTAAPTYTPTKEPTQEPTAKPTEKPTEEPTVKPTEEPTQAPPTAQPGADLIGPTWRWTGLVVPTGDTPSNPSQYTVRFNADGSLAIQADCNSGSGSYTINGNSISIHLGVMTQAACPEGSLSAEFLSLLSSASSYSVQGSNLSLATTQGSTMTFVQ